MLMLTVLSFVAAVWSTYLAHRSLSFSSAIRVEDDHRASETSARLQRDARLGMKLQLYADYARGSMRTIREFAAALAALRHPDFVLSDPSNRVLFQSYLYDAQLGMRVADYCVGNMFAPTRDDLKLRYDLENEFAQLQNNEFQLLSLLGVDAKTLADSAMASLEDCLDIRSDYVTTQPLPSTTLADPLKLALARAERRPVSELTPLYLGLAAPAVLARFWGPDGEPITPSSDLSGADRVHLGEFRWGFGSSVAVRDFYFERSPHR